MKKNRLCLYYYGGRGRKRWLIIMLSVFFMFIFSVVLGSNTYAQQEKVNLNLKNVSIKTLFHEIQKQTDLFFVYNTEQTEVLGDFTVQAVNETVESVLKRVLENTGFTYKFEGDIIIIRKKGVFLDQDNKKKEIKIQGKVTDSKQLSLPGVTISIKGTKVGCITDTAGHFTITLPELKDITLVFIPRK